MPARLLLVLLVLLAACATPQERCIATATRELRLITNLIRETETNLARGYAIEETVVYRPVWVYCEPPIVQTLPDGSRRIVSGGRRCLDDRPETIRRPRAIDPIAERNKLKGLQDRQAALLKQAEPAVAQCRALYPQ